MMFIETPAVCLAAHLLSLPVRVEPEPQPAVVVAPFVPVGANERAVKSVRRLSELREALWAVSGRAPKPSPLC